MKLGVRGANTPTGFLGIRGSGRPPFFSDLIQWACGDPVTVDGETYIQDKKGKSGVVQGRDEVLGAYFNGIGSPYITSTVTDADLGTNYFISTRYQHNSNIGARGVFGSDNGGVDRFYIQANENSNTNNYLLGVYDPPNIVTTSVQLNDYVELKLEVIGSQYMFYVDRYSDSKFESPISQESFGPFSFTKILNNKPLEIGSQGEGVNTSYFKYYSFDINGLQTYFQSTDSDTKVQFFNRTTGEVVIGEIQNATGNDLVSTTDYPSDMNDNGYTLARALEKNLLISPYDGNYTYDSTGFIDIAVTTEKNTNYTISLENYLSPSNGQITIRDGNGDLLFGFGQGTGLDVNTTVNSGNYNEIFVRYFRADDTGIDISYDSAQVEEGTTPTTYEPWVGYYYDSALTLPVPDGTLGYNVNGKTTFFTAASTPEYASSEFVGGLKADIRVIDGVVDNGVGYSKWVLDDGIENNTSNGINITLSGETLIMESSNESIEPSQIYTIVFNVSVNTLDVGVRVSGSRTCFNSTSDIFTAGQTGEYRALITSDSVISAPVGFSASPDGATNGNLQSTVSIYKGDYVTGSPPLPTQGQPVVGNSWIQHTRRYDLIQADKLTTTEQYDQTDANNVFALPVEITGPVDDNPLFIQTVPSFCLIQYDRVITNIYSASADSELYKVLKFQDMIEKAEDTNGDTAVDTNNVVGWAYKSEVTVL